MAALYGWDCAWPLEKCKEIQGTGEQKKGLGCGEQKTATALAEKACYEQTKSILGKKASVGPEAFFLCLFTKDVPMCRAKTLQKTPAQHGEGRCWAFLSDSCLVGRTTICVSVPSSNAREKAAGLYRMKFKLGQS